MAKVSIKELLEIQELQLEVLAGHDGLNNQISVVDINRPGLALVGFYENFAYNRLQVIGKGEYSYINKCSLSEQINIIRTFLSYPIPAVLFTHNHIPPSCVIDEANQRNVPILKTILSTHEFQMKYFSLMSELLAEEVIVHGVLLDVFGVGLLIQGESGIGKSETAIELIERGHRLIADDVVKIKAVSENTLYGYTIQDIEYHMELRGIGIINIKDIYGIRATRKKIQIDLAVYLEEWKDEKEYDRLGLDENFIEILKVKIPCVSIPIRPGRNIPILIETAAMNFRLKTMGYNLAENFLNKMQNKILSKKDLSNKLE
ncbi:MAG: HPr(Ser) kinase/phosphatase [Leptospiraceae bacterium]|nr:HPr(Ser) kinase/phosphatase [Leptospiraceae bacterium]MDW7976101.1 HPr(Ser) kinase/phosphatase [Leptospiraceae bacterium]